MGKVATSFHSLYQLFGKLCLFRSIGKFNDNLFCFCIVLYINIWATEFFTVVFACKCVPFPCEYRPIVVQSNLIQ